MWSGVISVERRGKLFSKFIGIKLTESSSHDFRDAFPAAPWVFGTNKTCCRIVTKSPSSFDQFFAPFGLAVGLVVWGHLPAFRFASACAISQSFAKSCGLSPLICVPSGSNSAVL